MNRNLLTELIVLPKRRPWWRRLVRRLHQGWTLVDLWVWKDADETVKIHLLTIRLFFAWYDAWMGVFVDRRKQRLYLCLLPMISFEVDWSPL